MRANCRMGRVEMLRPWPGHSRVLKGGVKDGWLWQGSTNRKDDESIFWRSKRRVGGSTRFRLSSSIKAGGNSKMVSYQAVGSSKGRIPAGMCCRDTKRLLYISLQVVKDLHVHVVSGHGHLERSASNLPCSRDGPQTDLNGLVRKRLIRALVGPEFPS